MEHGSRQTVPSSESFVRGEGGALTCDGVALCAIAAAHGTPSYVYSAADIERSYRRLDAAMGSTPHLLCYACKANGHPEIVGLLAKLGAGADVVSGGELYWALKSGVPAERIVISGVGKTDAELDLALRSGIRAIHLESEPELRVLEELAASRGVRANVGLRINPDVDAKTHPYISTGLHGNKFGLELDVARRLLPGIVASEHLRLHTIACHIGSQLPTARPLEDAIAITAAFAKECIEAGAKLEGIDVGGGFPITYGDEDAPFDPWSLYGEAIRKGIERAGASGLGLEVVMEPGRALVGDAGVLLTRVLHVKEQAGKRFVIVDAAMTELIRPALYEAYHAIVPVAPREGELTPADIVGPVCESADFLGQARLLPPIQRGDLLAVRGAGAYGASMGSRYNARPLAAEVLVADGEARVIRAREKVEDLYR